jgi:hypothetical protein
MSQQPTDPIERLAVMGLTREMINDVAASIASFAALPDNPSEPTIFVVTQVPDGRIVLQITRRNTMLSLMLVKTNTDVQADGLDQQLQQVVEEMKTNGRKRRGETVQESAGNPE